MVFWFRGFKQRYRRNDSGSTVCKGNIISISWNLPGNDGTVEFVMCTSDNKDANSIELNPRQSIRNWLNAGSGRYRRYRWNLTLEVIHTYSCRRFQILKNSLAKKKIHERHRHRYGSKTMHSVKNFRRRNEYL